MKRKSPTLEEKSCEEVKLMAGTKKWSIYISSVIEDRASAGPMAKYAYFPRLTSIACPAGYIVAPFTLFNCHTSP